MHTIASDNYDYHFSILKEILFNPNALHYDRDNRVLYSGNIYYIEKGIAFITNEYNILDLTIKAPAIVGLASMFGATDNYQSKLEPEAIIYALEPQVGYDLIKKNHAFESVSVVMSHNFIRTFNNLKVASLQNGAYQAIRECIYELDFHSRNNGEEFKVISYVMRRTNLSRSYTSKVISELKKGGWISISQGYFKSINKNLPSEF